MLAVGASASVGFALLYLACVLADLWFPDLVMYRVWAPLLPGFEWLSWSNFFLGLVEAAAYGWLIALAFVPPYNFVSERLGP
ncbi:MAG: hypothetical protein HY521_07705 [Proteobacteria bacterium]|nr:hypothetical protein [Pseudomonadota bacterium]